MSEKHETATDALQAVMVAACAHVSATGTCDDVPFDYDEHDGPYCHSEACTYCRLARAVDQLPEEMKP
jgi:hypothetical protein